MGKREGGLPALKTNERNLGESMLLSILAAVRMTHNSAPNCRVAD